MKEEREQNQLKLLVIDKPTKRTLAKIREKHKKKCFDYLRKKRYVFASDFFKYGIKFQIWNVCQHYLVTVQLTKIPFIRS